MCGCRGVHFSGLSWRKPEADRLRGEWFVFDVGKRWLFRFFWHSLTLSLQVCIHGLRKEGKEWRRRHFGLVMCARG
jgi:hypothetical protein